MLRYRCTVCGSLDGNDVPFQTPMCCGKVKEIFQDQQHVEAPLVSIFHEGFYEHIDAKPIYIKSRKQLRSECRSRGLTSDYAE